MCNVVSLKNTRDLAFIDLSIPSIEIDAFDETSVYQIVLPLACSLRVNNPTDTFKPEYIIPQNVLSCIVQRNSIDVIEFDGVMYTSTVFGRSECIFNEKERLINYVIPIKTTGEKGLCERLVQSFELTEPTSMLMERLKENVRASYLAHNRLPRLHIYDNTIWGVTEDVIVESPHAIIA